MAELEKCAVSGKCGGCVYTGISYEKQLEKKQKYMEGLLGKFGKVLPIIGMDDPAHYRNKVHHVIGSGKSGGIISGCYAAGTHKVINVNGCLIEDEICQKIIFTIRDLARSFKLKPYDEDLRRGLLRHVLVRRGFESGEVMVVLVLSGRELPGKNAFVKALLALHPEITTIVININSKKTSMVLGDKNIPIYGPGYITDTLCGCRFRISPDSFYQVNPVQTEVLYKTAAKYAALTGEETVLDAYCGIGTIGLSMAGQARRVIGVELNGNAVRDAMANAELNHIKNARFYKGDAGAFLDRLAGNGGRAKDGKDAMPAEKPDVIIMDPPRSGSSVQFITSAVRISPKRIVYISCGPESLKRDLQTFKKLGYHVGEMQPVDMFPYTEHVECCVLLERMSRV